MLGAIKKKLWAKLESDMEKDFESQKISLEKKHREKLDDYKKELTEKEYERELGKRRLDDETKEQLDLKVRYEKANNDLREQIKLIEAKASPDNVYIEAFTLGFSKAFDMLEDVIGHGFRKSKDALINKVKDEERTKVDKIVKERIEKIDSYKLKEKAKILDKIKSFRNSLVQAERLKDVGSINKFKYYIEALEWRFDEENN